MPSEFFTFAVVCASGQGNLTEIEPAISVNDSGRVAFVGTTATGQSVFTAQANGALTPISFPAPTANRTYGHELQINNAGQVAVIDMVAGLENQRRVRIWDSSAPGTNLIVARSSIPPFDAVFFDSVAPFAALSPNGRLAFAGLVNPATAPAQWKVHMSANPVGRSDVVTLAASLEAGNFFRLSCSDGAVIIGSKTAATKRIIVSLVGGPTLTIAATGSDWSDLGVRPSVSRDGKVVVFSGHLTAAGANTLTTSNGDAVPFPLRPGRGVFASVALGNAPLSQRCVLRVAGETANNELDPGERLSIAGGDSGPDLNFDGVAEWGLNWSADDLDQRVGVSNLLPVPAAQTVSRATIVYAANDPIHGGAKALFSSRLNLFADDAGSLIRAGVESPVQFARVGETIQGLNVSDLAIHDCVSGSGIIAFWVNAGTSRAVLTAERNTRIMASATTTGPPQAFVNTINNRPRFDPDSPLAEYVIPGVAGAATRLAFNQIVLHATAGRERGNIRDVSEDSDPGIHYLISREGRVTQVLPERLVANHAQPNNRTSIGIELVDDFNGTDGSGTGHREDASWLTPVQMRKAARLVRDIALRRSIPLTQPGVLPSALHPATNGSRPSTAAFNNHGDPAYQAGNGALAEDGYDPDMRGILAHGQVLNRTDGKDDPRIFDWTVFMTLVNQAVLLRFDQ